MVSSFYGPVEAQSYDTDDNPHEIIQFYLAEWARLGKPSPVLEPMCGTGLNLIPFCTQVPSVMGLIPRLSCWLAVRHISTA